MKISGKILNVKDGDAIVIKAYNDEDSLLIVIDGGKKSYSSKVINELEKCCDEMEKEGPDLVVCTHYDSDHIAGIIAIIDHFKNKIKKVWVHQPQGVLKDSLNAAPLVLEHIENNQKVLTTTDAYLLHQNYLSAEHHDEYKLIIETVEDLNILLDKIQAYQIITEEPIVGECKIEGWEEIKVIGPKRNYFDKVFGKPQSLLQLFQDEYIHLIKQNILKENFTSADPCSLLKTRSDITATNKASAIIRFDCEDGRYLFTADAGIESLKETEGYPESIKDVRFLKIPHHGSNNNISKELIEIINPEIAYNSGNIHEDAEVIACLRKKAGRIVKTTKEFGDLEF
ncbi:ComEC/Rec2 family competence protein [Flavobacterium sp. F52]|uniref:ComEC/Rec2 family competence protein n=1 Tax=Flavobacterium sp. F52 TaxID=1202532 RepID=UPI000272DBF3|nr:MBL fold metallo-hydrolase [Flavobacterium sp. F52]EJG03205.1 putative hydrolase [Flavobacterium sp. F52]